MNKKILFIVNPASASGKTARRFEQLRPAILQKFPRAKILMTEKSGHATELTRIAIKEKMDIITAVGGDGTISEVVGGFFDTKGKLIQSNPKRGAKLAIIAAGSGSDFIKSTNIPRDDQTALDIIATAQTRIIDAGLCHYINHSGKPALRAFINISDVGIGGEVMHLLESEGKKFGAWLSYQLATVRSLLHYKNKNLTLYIDKQVPRSGIFNGVMIANGKYFGSGMKIAPGADIQDGLFDIILIKEMSRFGMIAKLGKLKNGTHIDEPGVEVIRCKKIRITAADEPSPDKLLIEVDGEPVGKCPVEFSLVPQAIALIDRIET